MAEIQRITSDDDPERCQSMIDGHQCYNKVVPGTQYCPIHGGVQQKASQDRERYRNYQLQRWQSKLNRFAENDHIKSLRDEAGILRMILEEKLNQLHDEHDLILNSHIISDLVLKIEKVVSSMNKLDIQMGQMMDRQALLRLASGLAQIITEEVEDTKVVESVINRFEQLMVANFGDDDEA
jgi:uncharacterized Zn finger protein (UPF0148 family)